MDNATPPRKRAGNADRDRVAEMLKDALADGQLTITEFDERSHQLWAATFVDELAPLTADLSPVAPPTSSSVVHHGPRDVAAPRTGAPARVTGEPGGSSSSFSIMGEVEKRGDWHVAPSHTSIAVMGGNTLDLTRARLSAQETVIHAIAVMGGIEIIVPEDVRVVDDGFGIMGGFGITGNPGEQLPPDAPVVRVRGLALMGGVEIKRV